MAGVSDWAFRGLVRSQGVGLSVTEMHHAQALVRWAAPPADLRRMAEEYPLSVQLAGSDPAVMAQAARLVVGWGAAVVDINLGCPVDRIVQNREGSGLLLVPELAVEVAQAVVEAVPVPVTVKMRVGWDRDHIVAPSLAERFEAVGVAALVVHARTREDRYARPADWRYIRAVKERVGIPVIGNGDIGCGRDVVAMLEQTGADGAMIGRASLGDPWIFKRVVHYLRYGRDLTPPDAAERAAMAAQHIRRLTAAGERPDLGRVRKQLAWYLRGTEGSAEFRRRAQLVASTEEALALIAQWQEHAQHRVLNWQ